MMKVMTAILVLGLMGSPAWATPLVDNSTNANASASASGGTHVQTNTQVNTQTTVNTNVNTQGQSQNQGQQQGQVQGQGQRQSADNKGNNQSVNVESSLIPGVAVAPGLTAGGSQVCLGSFSVGLSGPMAGVAFGKTVVDKGCEDRQNAILLFNMGFRAEALELLKGNERVKVLFPTTPLAGEITGVTQQVLSPTIPEAMAVTQNATISAVQGN